MCIAQFGHLSAVKPRDYTYDGTKSPINKVSREELPVYPIEGPSSRMADQVSVASRPKKCSLISATQDGVRQVHVLDSDTCLVD